ncbi:hypothetical protein [Alkalibacillus aidingensis]|uniref:hypothetical protein n=1 Tax=Alkalibacillus aidingensis TaxID=2747607 RepID=UPI00166032FD|nr:hypothetical protein [Alkalibacillus aidingensis]
MVCEQEGNNKETNQSSHVSEERHLLNTQLEDINQTLIQLREEMSEIKNSLSQIDAEKLAEEITSLTQSPTTDESTHHQEAQQQEESDMTLQQPYNQSEPQENHATTHNPTPKSDQTPSSYRELHQFLSKSKNIELAPKKKSK